MKRKYGYLLLPALLLGLIGFFGCQTKGRLEKEIVGEWTSVPDRVTVAGSYSADMTRVFTFLSDGTVTVSANIEVVKALPDSGKTASTADQTASTTRTASQADQTVSPVSKTFSPVAARTSESVHSNSPVGIHATAVAEMSGTYKVKSSEEIVLNLTPSTYRLTVDPDAVRYVYDGLTAGESDEQGGLSAEDTRLTAELTELTPQYVAALTADMRHDAETYLLAVKQITRIHIVDSSMECTLAGKNLILTRPGF